jgi:RNA recognition motif-containing protein
VVQQRIYVGNLPVDAREEQLRDLFAPYGAVGAVRLPVNKDSGELRGFAFVEMTADAAAAAIAAIDGTEMHGSTLKVNQASERTPQMKDRGGERGPGRRN